MVERQINYLMHEKDVSTIAVPWTRKLVAIIISSFSPSNRNSMVSVSILVIALTIF